MDVMKFCDSRGIKWFPIRIGLKTTASGDCIVDGAGNYKKEILRMKEYTPRTSDFKMLKDEEIDERKKHVDRYEHIAMDTSHYYQVDFDTGEHKTLMDDLMTKCPYYMSSTKKLPHCFILSDIFRQQKYNTIYTNVELICGLWSFSRKDAIVHNATMQIPRIPPFILLSANAMCHRKTDETKVDDPKTTLETLRDIVFALNDYRCSAYNDWLMVIFCILKAGVENGYYDKAVMLAHDWSMQNDAKYDRKGLETVISHFESEKSPSVGTLYFFLKMDNPIKFREMVAFDVEVETDVKNEYSIPKERSYSFQKEIFEKRCFKVLNPPCYVTYVEGKGSDFMVVREAEVVAKYKHVQYFFTDDRGNCASRSFVHDWLNDSFIKAYSTIDFLPPPLQCPVHVFNLWKGFRMDSIEAEPSIDISIILEHINVLCDHDPSVVDYFIKWLAQIVQEPANLSRIAVVLKGDKGVGKNIMGYFMQSVIGDDYYAEVSREEELFGQFSNSRKHRLLINIDEMKLPASKQSMLKNMITSTIYNYEAKGVMPIRLRNVARLLCTTNEDLPFPIEVGDRRVLVICTDNSKRNDKGYMDKLVGFCGREENQKAFYNYLKSLDGVKNKDWINDRPNKEEYREMQQQMIPIEARYLESYVNEMNREKEKVSSKDMYRGFREYMEENGYCQNQQRMNNVSFGIRLKGYRGVKKSSTKKGVMYEIDRNEVHEGLKEKEMNTMERIREIREGSESE